VTTAVADALGYSETDRLAMGTGSLGELYTSASVLAFERANLFDRSWSIVADSDELAAPGSYLTTSLQNVPLAIVRDELGTLRAFHNICRHRGITLLEGSGTLGRFMTCPYHQWSYGLDGQLVRVPQQPEEFPDLEKCALGLHGAQVAEWQGMVFVNPSVQAGSLGAAMAGLDGRLEQFVDGPLREVARVEYAAACNWKLLVENHIDVYHLWYLHARSLGDYDHRSFTWESLGDNWWSLEPLKDPAKAYDGLDWIPDEMRHRIGAYLLFPNLMLVTTDHYFATYDAQPITPDRTNLTLRVRAVDQAAADGLVASIRSFMSEDVAACERMQAGASSPHFGVGGTARSHEAPILRFHSSLRRRMLS
jgi:phenylpropionate dioxygenase-like ring-hydroxylating dioxygenase large terminal subunit